MKGNIHIDIFDRIFYNLTHKKKGDHVMKVLGIEKLDYVSKQTNKQVKGTKLYLCWGHEKTEGYRVGEVFVPESVDCNVKLGNEIDLLYNQYHKVAKVTVLE